MPPSDPLQVHVRVVPHAVAPLSPDTVPALQAPAVVLHDPFTDGVDVQIRQGLPVGGEPKKAFFAPQPTGQSEPLVSTGQQVLTSNVLWQPLATAVWHDAVVPPPDPVQVHAHALDTVAPLTADGVPAAQRPVVGDESGLEPCALPQAPLTPPPDGGQHLMVWVYSPFPHSVLVVPVSTSPGLQVLPL